MYYSSAGQSKVIASVNLTRGWGRMHWRWGSYEPYQGSSAAMGHLQPMQWLSMGSQVLLVLQCIPDCCFCRSCMLDMTWPYTGT